MAIYAISDLHLSFGTDKPMNVFGWADHPSNIKENWLKVINDDDYVLIPGDISWGINLEEAAPDLEFIDSLPGKKILSKGNHDYWWSTLNKFRSFFDAKGFTSLNILHNNAYRAGSRTICGTRGWKPQDDEDFTQEDRKIFNRELERLRLSLREAVKLGGELIAMLHYPPFDLKHNPNEFSQILKEFNVKTCIYGHIHGKANETWKDETIDGIRYLLVSCNIVDFNPVKLYD
ncbi:MAG: serine/threonine protein phosphatase [Clostridiaceae bacterium]|nr:serine/threonine protein phosphatase [Clostridiaceae bacterium]